MKNHWWYIELQLICPTLLQVYLFIFSYWCCLMNVYFISNLSLTCYSLAMSCFDVYFLYILYFINFIYTLFHVTHSLLIVNVYISVGYEPIEKVTGFTYLRIIVTSNSYAETGISYGTGKTAVVFRILTHCYSNCIII